MVTTSAVVVGGGLAGVASVQELSKLGAHVTLVDRNDYHQFQPLLYQVATAQLPAEDIARPLSEIVDGLPGATFLQGEVTAIDPETRSVTVDGDRVLPADVLVLAAGGVPAFHGVAGADEHTFPLYSVADAERLRLHLREVLDRAMEGSGDADVVVVGAGPTGVETTGAVCELVRALEAVGRIPAGRLSVHLVDAGHTLLPAFSDRAHRYAFDSLAALGADIRLEHGVAAVHADHVVLQDGTSLAATTVVWGGGESGAPVASLLGVPLGRGGRIDVTPELTVPGLDGVYAVGDVANVPAMDRHGEADGVLPQLGSVAQQSGSWAARNAMAVVVGHKAHPFHYKDKGIMAMIGRNAAVAEMGRRRHEIDGPVAFGAWLGVHAMLLSGVHSRTDAFLSWARNYADRDHAAVVESWSNPRRIVWADDDVDRPHILPS